MTKEPGRRKRRKPPEHQGELSVTFIPTEAARQEWHYDPQPRHPAVSPPFSNPGRCCRCNAPLTGRRRSWCSNDCIDAHYRDCGFSWAHDVYEANIARFGGFGRCCRCGASFPRPSGDRGEADHIRPIALGGDPVAVENGQMLCVACHRAKTRSDMRLIVAARKRARLRTPRLEAFA